MDTTRTIYAILDLVANDIIGGLHIHRHEAAAIRFFSDIANMPDSNINRHPADFQLVQLGHLNEKHQIVENYKLVITGAQWAAAQLPDEPQQPQIRPMGAR